MSERSERIMNTGFVRRPGAERVIGAPDGRPSQTVRTNSKERQ
jgi:hypothetical protein